MLPTQDSANEEADASLLHDQRMMLAACAELASDGLAADAVVPRRSGLTRDLREIAVVTGVHAQVRRRGAYVVARFTAAVDVPGEPGVDARHGPRVA